VIARASIASQFKRASGDGEGTLADARLAGLTRSHQPCKTAIKTGLLLKSREYCRSPSASCSPNAHGSKACGWFSPAACQERRLIDFVQTPAAPVNPKELHGVQLIAAYVILALLVLALLSFVIYIIYSTPIAPLLTLEIFMGLGGWVFIPDPYKRSFTAAVAVLFLSTFSFFVGYSFAAGATATADPNNLFQPAIGTINLKSGAPINGRIIRSGERGVLIYDPVSDRLRFLLLEGISSIEAPPGH
jgi:hypothetical protein